MTGAARGRAPRVGVVGADVPRQLVLASGATPVRIPGSWSGPVSSEASELPGAVDVVAARILDTLLSGAHDDLAGLVVCNDSVADLRVFYVLRILADRGRVPFPVHLLDAPRGGGGPRDRFVRRQYERLLSFCASVTGRAADARSLREAADRESELGRALGRLRQRRRAGACTGVAALEAYRAAATLPPEDAIDAADDRGDWTGAGPGTRGTPVLVTGSSHPDPSVYAAIEAVGLRVIGEDHDAGDAAWIGDAVAADDVGGAIAALARRHAARPPLAARSRTAERVAALDGLLRDTRAAAVIALVRDLDDAPAWDLAGQRTLTTRHGVPLVERTRIAPDAAAGVAAEAAGELARALGAVGAAR